MLDVFYSRKACNSYIVYNDNKEGFLVDPGYNANNVLIEHIKKIGVNIKAILITHAHVDHVEALDDVIKEFPDAVTYIDTNEVEVLANPKYNLTKFNNGLIIDKCPKNLIELTDGEEFDLCGYHLKMISTPFHTKGSCCYLIPSELIMFTGDTLFYTTIGRSDLPTGSERQIIPSLSKILAIKENYRLYPGHGVATTLERERNYNVHLRNI